MRDNITSGDLAIGMVITVTHGMMMEVPDGEGFGDFSKTKTQEDTSYQGDILEIVAIKRPFMVVKNLRSKYGAIFSDKIAIIDIRRFQFMELSEDFIKAAVPDYVGKISVPQD